MEKLEDSFLEAVHTLRNINLLSILGWEALSEESSAMLELLASHVTPFLKGLQLVCQYLLGCRDSDLDVPVGELVKKCQCSAELQLQEGALSDYRVLSLDMLNNCLVCLCSLDAAKKEKRKDSTILVPNLAEVSMVLSNVNFFLLGSSSSTWDYCDPHKAKL